MNEIAKENKRIGVFPGSFDPFTIGHKDIAERAMPLFDELIILVGYNEAKHYEQTTEQRAENIRRIFADEPRVKVDSWNGLTIDYCSAHDAHYIIKGVRSVKDFEYERDQAYLNRHYTEVETLLLYCDPRYSAVSSSMIKVIKAKGKDVSEFLP